MSDNTNNSIDLKQEFCKEMGLSTNDIVAMLYHCGDEYIKYLENKIKSLNTQIDNLKYEFVGRKNYNE